MEQAVLKSKKAEKPVPKGRAVATRKRPMQFWRKKVILFAVFVFCSVFCEMMVFLMMGFGLFPRYFLIDLAIILCLAGVIYAIPLHWLSITLGSIVFFGQCLLSGINVTVYSMLQTFLTVDLLSITVQAAEAFFMTKINWWLIVPYVLFFFVFLAAEIVLLVKVKSEKFSMTKQNSLFLAGLFVICSLIFPLSAYIRSVTLPDDGESNLLGVSTKENFEYLSFENNFFKEFGTFSMFYKNFILGRQPGAMPPREISVAAKVFERSDYFGIDEGNNVITVMTESFDTIFMSEKYTPHMYQIHNEGMGFSNYHTHNKTDVSEAIGILGNYPQSGTLAMEWSSGEDGRARESRRENFSYNFPFSTPNVLRDNGYGPCNYFIAHNSWYYSREYTHKAYGFDGVHFNESYPTNPNFSPGGNHRWTWKAPGGEEVPMSFEDYESYIISWSMPERYYINSALNDMLPMPESSAAAMGADCDGEPEEGVKPFYSYFSLINPHLPYDYDPALNTGIFRVFYDAIDDADFSDFRERFGDDMYRIYKNALAKAMVADDGIGYLFCELENRGLSENTTVMLYSDHCAYGDNFKFILNDDPTKVKPHSYNLPATIWSKNIAELPEEARRIDKFVNTFDLVPTLYDLLGVEIDPNIYLGNSAFSVEESIVISKLSNGIFNDKIYMIGKDVLFTAPDVAKEDLNQFSEAYWQTYAKWSKIHKMFLK
ncbi:MAG: sulfatase-like hydrolase/transferase [Firmicutes bacterium]|nr:sulfatase-like hydrolase/transferase [Bacillota bacterium]